MDVSEQKTLWTTCEPRAWKIKFVLLQNVMKVLENIEIPWFDAVIYE